MTQDQQHLRNHLQFALELLPKVEAQVQALRAELFSAQKRAEEAEKSRDTIRAHAQASLDKYRAQNLAMGRALARLLQVQVNADRFPVGMSVTNLELVDGAVEELRLVLGYNHENTPPGFEPCTRAAGHLGPCALPFKES
jgi:vacuolar-type H+-ATPase subunit H